jgi:hypothetical protein
MDLQTTLQAFLDATTDVRGEAPRLNELAPNLLELAQALPKGALDEVLARLVRALSAPHPQVAGFVALMGGCLVEKGADAGLLLKALLPRVEQALMQAPRALEAATDLPDVESEEDPASALPVGGRMISARGWQTLVKRDPSSAQSLLALDHLCRALIAALTRAPEMLKTGPVQALSTPLTVVCEASEFAHFLARLLRVPMDEEWFVIDPRTRRGFAFHVSGVANAFQVYALLHAALCRVPRSLAHWSRPIPGPPPSDRVLSVAKGSGPQETSDSYVPPFTLFRWSAITDSRRVPNNEDFREWYSNSAVPAELAHFEGRRIGVLGNFGFKMVFGVAREFCALPAQITLRRELERPHVLELLHAFSSAPHPGHPVPGVGWP